MKLTKEQMEKAYSLWKKSQKTESLSTNFTVTIHPEGKQTKIPLSISQLKSETKIENVDSSGEESLPQETKSMPEDFVEVTYRAISASLMEDRLIDFSDEKMLKRSTKLLKGQTVFKDHDLSVNNWVGTVTDAFWDEDTKGIPPGINGKLQLDSIKDPMVVRGVLQGALHSASVTVSFEWKPSHPDLMETNTFFSSLGEEIGGQLVRLIVTKILKYWEISLVWQGADKYAKQINEDGEPIVENFSSKKSEDLSNLDNNKQEETMDKLKKLLQEKFGVEVTEENFAELLDKKIVSEKNALFDENVKLKESNKEIQEKFEASRKELEESRIKLKELTPDAECGKKYRDELRAEAIRLYKVAKGEKFNELIVKTLEATSDLEIIKAWKDDFSKEAEEKFPAQCGKCKSTDISRQSSNKTSEKEVGSFAPVVNDEEAKRLKDLHR